MAELSSSLNIELVAAVLGPFAHRFDVDAVATCDSTNTRLLDQAEQGAPTGTVLFADEQTAGRGRRGRTWYSAPGDSLTFSLVWRFPSGSQAPAALSLVVGLALARALESLGTRGISLKWPNDVLMEQRKLAGILVQLLPGNIHAAVIGIGINLRLPANMPAEVSASAIALDKVMPTPDREKLLAVILANIAATFDTYTAGGFAALREDWLARHAFQNMQVTVSGEGETRSGICAGVDAEGALLLESEGRPVRIIGGEISLRAT